MSEFLFDPQNAYLGLFAGDGSTPVNPQTDQPNDTSVTDTSLTGEPAVSLRRINLGHVYHVQYPQMKCDENSERGIRYAKRHGFSIDLDMQKDKVGNVLIDHWQELMLRDGWYDPSGHINKNRTLDSMTPDEWGRLTTKHHDKLLTVDEAFAIGGQVNIKAFRLEPKAGNHWTLSDAQHIYALAREHRVPTVIATLTNDSGWRRRLATFKEAGFGDVRRLG